MYNLERKPGGLFLKRLLDNISGQTTFGKKVCKFSRLTYQGEAYFRKQVYFPDFTGIYKYNMYKPKGTFIS